MYNCIIRRDIIMNIIFAKIRTGGDVSLFISHTLYRPRPDITLSTRLNKYFSSHGYYKIKK